MQLGPTERLTLILFGGGSVALGFVLLVWNLISLPVKLAAGLPLIVAGAMVSAIAVRGNVPDFEDEHEPTVLMALERLYLGPIALLSAVMAVLLARSGLYLPVRIVLTLLCVGISLLLGGLTIGKLRLFDPRGIPPEDLHDLRERARARRAEAEAPAPPPASFDDLAVPPVMPEETNTMPTFTVPVTDPHLPGSVIGPAGATVAVPGRRVAIGRVQVTLENLVVEETGGSVDDPGGGDA